MEYYSGSRYLKIIGSNLPEFTRKKNIYIPANCSETRAIRVIHNLSAFSPVGNEMKFHLLASYRLNKFAINLLAFAV